MSNLKTSASFVCRSRFTLRILIKERYLNPESLQSNRVFEFNVEGYSLESFMLDFRRVWPSIEVELTRLGVSIGGLKGISPDYDGFPSFEYTTELFAEILDVVHALNR